jgi:hypothetical protein
VVRGALRGIVKKAVFSLQHEHSLGKS